MLSGQYLLGSLGLLSHSFLAFIFSHYQYEGPLSKQNMRGAGQNWNCL